MKDDQGAFPGARNCKGLRLPAVGQRNLKNHPLDATHIADTLDSLLRDIRPDDGIVAAACGHKRCRSVGEFYSTGRVSASPTGISVPGEAAEIALL